jgi:outer membrane receptor protein involved in Fe transport
VQLRIDDVNDIELSRTKSRTSTITQLQSGDLNEGNAAAYLSQKLMLTKKLTATIGLRYDYFRNRYLDDLIGEDRSAQASIVTPKLNFDLAVNKNVQFYLYNGRGFHSNDTRVVVAQKGKEILPPAYATDLGGVFKLGRKLILQTALWHLWLEQEFVYVGDEGIVEASGKSRRYGADASIRYEVIPNLFANVDVNYARPKALDVPKGEDNIPLAPKFTSLGGLVYKKQSGFNGSIFYRIMGNRPANEDYTITAKGYCIIDAEVNYTKGKWEAGLSVQNLLNSQWKETQFATESRLQNEPVPVTEIHFTPGNPFFAKAHFSILF